MNYLEGIAAILKEKQVARVRDIAAICKVKVPSACNALGRLSRLGYIHYKTGEYITLTATGLSITKKMEKRQQTIERFLFDILHMEADNAEQEARSLSLFISDQFYESIHKFLNSSTYRRIVLPTRHAGIPIAEV